MIRGIIIAVLTIGIAGTAYWGYQEHQEKNAILINAENNYQRAFHDLTYQMDVLHDKIGTTLAMNSRRSLSPALAEVWRITSTAHGDVGQLPLALMPFNKTEEFLANIGKFSYQTAVRDLDKEPLTDDEYSTLNKLYEQSAHIQKELRRVQNVAMKNNLRWMDVELALASGKGNGDNTIIDGFKTVEKHAEGFSENNGQNPTLASFQERDENYSHLKGSPISKKEAIDIAKRYANLNKVRDVNVTENGKGAKYGFYSVSLQSQDQSAALDITKRGGYPIWFINSREIGDQKLSLNEAGTMAERFLKRHHYKDLEMFESVQYDNTGLFTFVTNRKGTRIYPESIKVKIAMDNGEIIGFSASDYLKGQRTRNIPAAKLPADQARGKINKNVKIMEERLAVIDNEAGKEVLCHEFIGTLGNDTYRIFINAQSGDEEKVEKMKNAEPVYEDII